jgi:hypothetical protein
MSDIIAKLLEFITWLPLLTGVLGALGIILSVRGTLVARKEAYKKMDKDYLEQRQRIHDRLEQSRQSQKG